MARTDPRQPKRKMMAYHLKKFEHDLIY